MKTPVLPQGMDKLWALIGSGAIATPVEVPVATFSDATGATPSFMDIQQAPSVEALTAILTPSGLVLKRRRP